MDVVTTTQFTRDLKTAKADAVEWGLVMAKNATLRSLMWRQIIKMWWSWLTTKRAAKHRFFGISEIQNQSKDFQHISFHYTPRSCNDHPYSLAKLALKSNGHVVWIEPLPVDIKSIFSNFP